MRDDFTCTLHDLCRRGALFQAVRDMVRGYADFQIREFLKKRWVLITPEQIDTILTLAHQGIVAGGRLQRQPIDQPLPTGATPRIPR